MVIARLAFAALLQIQKISWLIVRKKIVPHYKEAATESEVVLQRPERGGVED